ncbi:hypothetical protein DPMN_050357 [Dreissena polymorpha]|uniref:Uncharacterized protein n=1 Tax=Dreissena polymorpha TaxID=45954 RepID=A0A9D4CHD0_DREPO|nr:hypothetical protein DPMN_050357 [Dreissena polymorpha]
MFLSLNIDEWYQFNNKDVFTGNNNCNKNIDYKTHNINIIANYTDINTNIDNNNKTYIYNGNIG